MCIGDIGERYIHNELIRRGITHSYLANSSKQEGWDIIIFKETTGNSSLFKGEKIQVKSLNWNNESSRVINGDFSEKSDFDYLCIVIVNYSKEESYISFMIPKEMLTPKIGKYTLYDDKKGKIQYTNSTITLNLLEVYKDKFLKISENSWENIVK